MPKNRRRRTPDVVRRSVAVDDIEIQRGGDGRTVTAYATPFDVQTEVRDQHGHYYETVSRSSFDKTLAESRRSVQVFYNHGMTIHNTPSERFSLPIGKPVDIRPDGKGLLTVTRFNESELADEVLELIRAGDITAYSYTARILRSQRIGTHQTGLPILQRTELGLREYGPTPLPVATVGAEVLSVRSLADLTAEIDELSDEERQTLLDTLSGTGDDAPPDDDDDVIDDDAPVDDPPPDPDTPDDDPAPSDRHAEADRLRLQNAQRRRR